MSNTWFVTLDHYGRGEDIVTIMNSNICCKKENNYYNVTLQNGIVVSFDKPILKIENEDDL